MADEFDIAEIENRASQEFEDRRKKELISRVRARDYILLRGIESKSEIEKLINGNPNKLNIILRNRYLDKTFIERLASCLKTPHRIFFEVHDEFNVDCTFNEKQTKKLEENIKLLQKKGCSTYFYNKLYRHQYTCKEIIEANRKLQAWENLIKNAKINGKEISNKAKYLLAYLTVSSFFSYSAESAKSSAVESRGIINVLTGDKIVCVGYVNVLAELLNKSGIPALPLSVQLGDSEEFHEMCLIYINDGEERGFILSDPTSQSLLYSFIPMQDIDKLFLNKLNFLHVNTSVLGNTKLEDFINACTGISKRDEEILRRYLQNKIESRENLAERAQNFAYSNNKEKIKIILRVIANDALKNKPFSNKTFIRNCLGYNNFTIFREDVKKVAAKFKDLSFDEIIESTANYLLVNKLSPLSFTVFNVDNSIKELSGNVNFTENVLYEVLESSLKLSKREEKSLYNALILSAINYALEEQKDKNGYRLNLQAENYFLNRLKNIFSNKDKDFKKSDLYSSEKLAILELFKESDDVIYKNYLKSNYKDYFKNYKKTLKNNKKFENISNLVKNLVTNSFKSEDKEK